MKRQLRRQLEVVLHKKRIGPCARRNKRVLHLRAAVVHHAKQEISEAISRLRPCEVEAANNTVGLVVVNGVVTELGTRLDTVPAKQFTHHIAELESRGRFV